MSQFLCCGSGQTTSSPKQADKSNTAKYQVESESRFEESHNLDRKTLSSTSANSLKPKQSKEKTEVTSSTSLTTRQPNHQGIPKLVTSIISDSGSVYATPPTSRHPSTKVKKVGSAAYASSSPQHSLNQSSPVSPENFGQALLRKIEMVEQKEQKRHDELLKVVTGLAEKLDKSEGRSDRVNVCRVTSGFPLTHKIPVCSKNVILELSKRVSKPQWKFLARRLYLPEHEIDQIEANHRENIQEQSYQMLLKWRESSGGGSYQELGEALRKQFGQQLYSDFVKIVRESEEQ